MRKWIVLAMVLGLLVGGCAHSTSVAFWVKDGKEVPPEQLRKEYSECRGPIWVKDGVSPIEFEKDCDACIRAEIEREKHAKDASLTLALGQLLTLPVLPISLSLGIASNIASTAGQKYFQRCMINKGYIHSPRKESADQCMKDKGYEWKETKGSLRYVGF